MLELDIVNKINAQFVSLNRRLDKLEKKGLGNTQMLKNCGYYQGEYSMKECPCEESNNSEKVAYLGNLNQMNNPYLNTYNPGWRNHPNFSLRKNNGDFIRKQNFDTPEKKSSLEESLSKFI